MEYRADLYTSNGRVIYHGYDPQELRERIIQYEGYVIGWRIVHVPSQKTFAYGSAQAELLSERIDRCMMQQEDL